MSAVMQHPQPETAAVPMPRIEIEVVGHIRQRVGLDAYRRDVLPTTQLLLVGPPPAAHPGGQRIASDLERQLLVLDVEAGSTHELCATLSKSAELKSSSVTICGRAGGS